MDTSAIEKRWANWLERNMVTEAYISRDEVGALLDTIASLRAENAELDFLSNEGGTWEQQIKAIEADRDRLTALLEEAAERLRPFARTADMEKRAGPIDTVGVNVARCRDARDFLTKLENI